MARSKDAIRKRAEKRDRSIGEQRKADGQDMEKQIAKKLKKDYNPYAPAPGERPSSHSGPPPPRDTSKSPRRSDASSAVPVPIRRPSSSQTQDPASEPGAWTCKSCGNHNFASRNNCNSNTCNERRPEGGFSPRPEGGIPPPPPRKVDEPKRQGSSNGSGGPLPNRQGNEEALTEAGAWVCKGCGNNNFASRKYCNSKTCSERRPRELAPQSSSKPKPRHDAETSKKIDWGENAPVEKINQNLELRKRYKDTGGEGMSEDEVKRAKLLLERDERKKVKKEEIKANRKPSKTASGTPTKEVVDTTTKAEDISKSVDSTTAEELKETDEKEDAPAEIAKETDTMPANEPEEATLSKDELRAVRKEQAKKLKKSNKRLRMVYSKTSGEGMDEKDVEKVKILLERDERKKRKRTEKEAEKEVNKEVSAQ
jgi:hypothetical protein